MFILDKEKQPLHSKIYNQIKKQILSGELKAHSRLPSIRHLAEQLSISRNTVEYAYGQLATEGFIVNRPQSGFYVSPLEQEAVSAPVSPELVVPSAAEEKQYTFDFHPAAVAPESFPGKVWRKLLSGILQEQNGRFSEYGNPQGEEELRQEIQRYLARFRGISCQAEQIVVCGGFQDSLSVAARLLQNGHGSLAVEQPGHWLPAEVFRQYSFAIQPVEVGEDGISLEQLQATDSTVVYITPSHQFPMGSVMPVENRLKLIRWAETKEGVILEDDYDSELRYRGKPIPALYGLQPEGRVIYLGTFSKVLSPALRVSYMVLPRSLLGRYRQLFGSHAAAVSLLEQRLLHEFMRQGYWERHLRKMRTIYKRKHDFFLQAIEHYWGAKARITGCGAGLHVTLELPEVSLTEGELIERARAQSVRVFPFSATCPNSEYSGRILLGFGRMSPQELEEGVKALVRAWDL